jgi:hypothetical protein
MAAYAQKVAQQQPASNIAMQFRGLSQDHQNMIITFARAGNPFLPDDCRNAIEVG